MALDKLLYVIVAAVCVVLLLRMALGEARRDRLDRGFIRAWAGLRERSLALWQWRRRRQSAEEARQAALDVIERVRHKANKEGNVIRPEAFKRPRKPH